MLIQMKTDTTIRQWERKCQKYLVLTGSPIAPDRELPHTGFLPQMMQGQIGELMHRMMIMGAIV